MNFKALMNEIVKTGYHLTHYEPEARKRFVFETGHEFWDYLASKLLDLSDTPVVLQGDSRDEICGYKIVKSSRIHPRTATFLDKDKNVALGDWFEIPEDEDTYNYKIVNGLGVVVGEMEIPKPGGKK